MKSKKPKPARAKRVEAVRAKRQDPRIGLIGAYDGDGITVFLHRPGCQMLKRYQNTFVMTEFEVADTDMRGFKTPICKCAKPRRLLKAKGKSK